MGLREPADGLQRGLEPADRLRVRRARNRALADLLVVHLGLGPHFAAQGVVGELVDPARGPAAVKRLGGCDDPCLAAEWRLPERSLLITVPRVTDVELV